MIGKVVDWEGGSNMWIFKLMIGLSGGVILLLFVLMFLVVLVVGFGIVSNNLMIVLFGYVVDSMGNVEVLLNV